MPSRLSGGARAVPLAAAVLHGTSPTLRFKVSCHQELADALQHLMDVGELVGRELSKIDHVLPQAPSD